MATGLTFRPETFRSVEDAKEWLSENAKKWCDALAVRAVDTQETLWNKQPNPDFGKEVWVIGAWCAN